MATGRFSQKRTSQKRFTLRSGGRPVSRYSDSCCNRWCSCQALLGARPCQRHVDAALGTAVWLAILPLLLINNVGKAAMSLGLAVLLLLLILLILHACVLRPRINDQEDSEVAPGPHAGWLQPVGHVPEPWEVGPEIRNSEVSPRSKSPRRVEIEESGEQDDVQREEGEEDDVKQKRPSGSYVSSEEIRLIMTLCVLACALGSVITLRAGSGEVLVSWLGGTAPQGCSVGDLGKFAGDGTVKFFCEDGFANVGDHVSLWHRLVHGGSQMTVFRMAAVYAKEGDKAPVALAVANDGRLENSRCGRQGLCGLVVSRESAFVRRAAQGTRAFDELRNALAKKLGPGADVGALPVVRLTDPWNPDGEAWHLTMGLVMYSVTLVGLIYFQMHLCKEEKEKSPFPGDGNYEPLIDNTALEDGMNTEGSNRMSSSSMTN